jgi:hypothetical protein
LSIPEFPSSLFDDAMRIKSMENAGVSNFCKLLRKTTSTPFPAVADPYGSAWRIPAIETGTAGQFSRSSRRQVAVAIAVAASFSPGLVLACTDNQPYANAESEGTHIFTAANAGVPFGGLVPFTGGYELNCSGGGILTVPTSAPAANGGTALVNLHATASYGPAAVHSQSSSTASAPLASRNTTPAIFADAASVLKFTVNSPTGARVRFDLVADGTYYGSSITGIGEIGGSAGFAFDAHSGAASVLAKTFDYRDSSGVHISNSSNSFFWNGPMRTATLAMSYDASFSSGGNWLQMDLYTYAWGAAAADFSNTGHIVGLTVLTPGATLDLPTGLFTADPNQSGHFILTSLLAPVPEPSSWVMMLGGLMLCLWRRPKSAV